MLALSASGCAEPTNSITQTSVQRLAEGAFLDVPRIDKPVVDTIGELTVTEEQELSRRLLALREKTLVQMAIVLVASTGVEPIEDFSMRLAEAWQGGRAGHDDGILLTLAMRDRRMRLEVGYGLEGDIPDAIAKHIVDRMRDDLRAGRTSRAIDGAIMDVGRRLSGRNASRLAGGYLERARGGIFAALPVTAAGAATALIFLFGGWYTRDTQPVRKPRAASRRFPPMPKHNRRAWCLLAVAMLIVAAALGWLYADFESWALEESLAYIGAASVFLGLGRPLDRKARTLETSYHRWIFFTPIFIELVLVTMSVAGLYLGSSDAVILLAIAGGILLVFIPFVLDGLGIDVGGGHSGTSGIGSSRRTSSASSSSSSSYSGGGGRFGGGGASSSW